MCSENKIYSTSDLKKLGLTKYKIKQMIDREELYRIAYGKYSKIDVEHDEFYRIQAICSKGLVTGMSALYLLGYSDRVSAKIEMLVHYGYNKRPLKNESNAYLEIS